MTVKYFKGDLFKLINEKTLSPLLLAHSCNCIGIWGGGIAKQFKINYFNSYKLYNKYCQIVSNPSDLLGKSLLLSTDENVIIVCLFTSLIGEENELEIVHNTKLSLIDLYNKLKDPKLIEDKKVRNIIINYNNEINMDISKYIVNMPLINSGIFRVSWGLTEKELIESELNCHVYKL